MSYGILPIKDTKSCGVCADKSADQNGADVPSGDVNKMQTPAEPNIDNGEVSVSDMAGDLVSRKILIGAIKKCGEEKIYPQALIEVIKALPSAEAAPVVAYICDRRQCAICRGEDGGCNHTTDIKHAARFKNVAGQYFERPYMEEDDG